MSLQLKQDVKSRTHHQIVSRQYNADKNTNNIIPIICLVHFLSGTIGIASIHSPTVEFNNLHVCSHKAEMGLARAYLKVQCNPVICRVVRKIHSLLTPIRVLSPPMQLIGPWCYLGNAEQFNTLTRLLLCRRARVYHSKNYISTPPSDHCHTCTFVHGCLMYKEILTHVVKEEK